MNWFCPCREIQFSFSSLLWDSASESVGGKLNNIPKHKGRCLIPWPFIARPVVQYISRSRSCIREVNAAYTVLEVKVNWKMHTKINQTAWKSVLTTRKHSRGQISWNDKAAQKISPQWCRLIPVWFAVLVSCPCSGGARGQTPALSPSCASPSWGWRDSPRVGCPVSWGQWMLVTMSDVCLYGFSPACSCPEVRTRCGMWQGSGKS